MHLGRAGTVGRTLADRRAADDESRLRFRLLGLINGGGDGFDVVTVHRTDHVPAVRFKAAARVVAEPALDVAVDRNSVVVV